MKPVHPAIRRAALILLLLAATAVRLYHIQAQSIWFDEGWSAYAALQPTLRAAYDADPTNPPLYYLLLNIATRGAGDSAFALRWFSALWGLLAVPLTYQLARRLFDSRAGLYAALLAAFSPLLWWASQEARMYTLLAVLVLVAALSWHELVKDKSAPGEVMKPHPRPRHLRRPVHGQGRVISDPFARLVSLSQAETVPQRSRGAMHRAPTSRMWVAWLVLWASELALLYAHNTGPVIVLWLNGVTLLVWLVRRSLRVPDWRWWIGGQILVGALWSPYFVSRFLLLQQANSAVTAAPQLNGALLGQIWQAFWSGPWALVGHEDTMIWLCAVLFLVTLLIIPWKHPAARWLIVHTLLLTVGLIAALVVLGNELHGRYLVMVTPLLLVPIGAGIARFRLRWLRYALCLPFLAVFAAAAFFAQNPKYQHDDARAMVRYYADHLTANDTVLDWSYADRYDLAYYWPRLGVRARRVTLPEGADLPDIAPLLPTSGDVALNVWYTQRADFRGMMGCVLGNGTINPPEEFTVYGMTDELYRSPVLDVPQIKQSERPFTIASVTGIGAIPGNFLADQALCLPIQITFSPPLSADLKAVVIVRNDLGWEIARADAIFADFIQQTSSQITPDGSSSDVSLTAYPLLRLPYGAPPGNYTLALRLYDETESPSGYDLADHSGKDMILGTWTVRPGADWSKVTSGSDLPVTVNQPVDGLTLLAHNQTGGTLANGDQFRLTLLWQGTARLPDLTLADDAGRWQIPIPAHVVAHDRITLDWRKAQIPPDADSGAAELKLPDGTILARYTIQSLPGQFTAPDFSTPVGVTLPGVGTLIGYTLNGDTFDRNQPIPITLVWQAGESAPETSYTVFVQLLDASGHLIAQSDSIPAQGSRPTAGWRSGEYIVDAQQVNFHQDANPGPATFIVGMYDALTGQRLHLADGSDAIPLPGTVIVR